jgi:hypothetical protein
MDDFGTYVLDASGERVLACPVLLRRDLATSASTVKPLSADVAFPPLPGSSAPVTEWTVAVAKGIDAAIREKKDIERAAEKAFKELKRQEWIDRYTARMEAKHGPRWYWLVEKTADDNEHAAYRRGEEDRYVDQMQDDHGSSWYIKVEGTSDDTEWAEYFRDEERAYIERMKTKYGPRWFYQVRGTEDETECAALHRYADELEQEEKDRRDDMMWEQIHASWEKEAEEEEKTREAKWALMTEDERWEEEHEYMDDLDDAMWSGCVETEYIYRKRSLQNERERLEYERNGWRWPPKG